MCTYVAELRALAEFSNFNETLELMLHDRLVCGMNDETTQQLLLAESKLTYKKVLEIATSQETASKNLQALRGLHSVHSEVGMFSLIELVHILKSGKQPVTRLNRNLRILPYVTDAICHKCGRGFIMQVFKCQM